MCILHIRIHVCVCVLLSVSVVRNYTEKTVGCLGTVEIYRLRSMCSVV